MKTIIIGKESLLSKHLKIYNKNSVIFSSRSTIEIKKIIKFINSQKNKINIIMNNFYPSAQIHSISNKNYDKFYEQSILFNAKIFSKIDPKKVGKIIYSAVPPFIIQLKRLSV